MRPTILSGLAAAALLLAGAAPMPPIGLSAPGSAPEEVGSAILGSLPAATVAVASRGGTVRYSGPRLWDVLGRAGATGRKPDDRLHEVVVVIGADGYTAPLALAEVDPAFEGKDVILALSREGHALDRPRLVIPGDRHPGRDVRDVVSVRVVAPSPP